MPIPAWPIDHRHQCICQIIQDWPFWNADEESQLDLTSEELQAYLVDFGEPNRVVNMTDPCPTFLHSYGNSTTSCPCGCRSGPFTMYRLRSRGLRGFMVIGSKGQMRFMHPKEMGFLLGFSW